MRPLKLIRRDLEINPGNVDAWLALAKMMDEAGDLEETLAAYAKARELDPGNPAISNRYARYLVSQYRFEEAEEILRDAEKKSPEDAGVLLNLASLLVYLNKEPDFASRLIERGSRNRPRPPGMVPPLGRHPETAGAGHRAKRKRGELGIKRD